MDDEHRGNGERGRQRVAVATMEDATERRVSDTGLTDATVAVEIGIDAEKTIVVEGLHDGNALPRGSPVDRRRDERKGIVAVDDVGVVFVDEGGDFAIGLRIPDCSEEEGKGTTKHAKYAKRGEGRLEVFRL